MFSFKRFAMIRGCVPLPHDFDSKMAVVNQLNSIPKAKKYV